IRRETENRIERRRLACSVGPADSEDTALFYVQVDVVQRDRCAKRFTEAACFYACHDFSSPPRMNLLLRLVAHLKMNALVLCHSEVLPCSGRAAESLRGPWAILRRGTSRVHPSTEGRAP